MMVTAKAAIASAALLAAVLVPSSVSAQSTIKDRIAGAVKAVEAACASDISKFCGNVTPGEGRLLVCMYAHDDQLSRSCQFSLYRTARNLDRALSRVERIADACWTDIEAQCGGADRIGQCVMEKSSALSPACQSVIVSLKQAAQGAETTGGR
jgi:hypothetical protein